MQMKEPPLPSRENQFALWRERMWGNRQRKILTLVCTFVIVLLATVGLWPKKYADPHAYCKAVVNMDQVKFGSRYIGPEFPPAVIKFAESEPVQWRCMDGEVLACLIGASGRGCLQMTAGNIASSEINRFCSENSNTDFVPLSVLGNSSSTWRCNGRTPVILKSLPLDKRGYLADAWRRIPAGDAVR